MLNQVIGWTPDGKSIVFLSRRDASNGWTKRPYTVSVDGGLAQPMPMDEGGLLSFSADGAKIAYNRIFRNFRQWKRYTGGLAQDITIYDIKNNVVDQVIPHTDYTDTFPMWHGNTIYFTSDRGSGHRLNLYSYDQGSKQVEQLTKFDEFDVMWPSLGPDAIIFENGGYLYTFDLQTRQPKKLTIYVSGERDQAMKHWVKREPGNHRLRYRTRRQASGVRGAGRGLHHSSEGWKHSQSDAFSGVREQKWRGRRMGNGSPTFRTAPAKMRSTLLRKTDWRPKSRSPADIRGSCSSRCGLRTARKSPGPTRT
jgi:tricorn protease